MLGYVLLAPLLSSSMAHAEEEFDIGLLFGLSLGVVTENASIKLDCLPDDIAIASTKGSSINSLIPAPIPDDSDVELSFSSCSKDGKLMSISFSINKSKALALERFYDKALGKLPSIEITANKSWRTSTHELTLSHLFEEKYAVSIRSLSIK